MCSKKDQINILLRSNNELLEEIKSLKKQISCLEEKEKIYKSRDDIVLKFLSSLEPLKEFH